MTRVADVTKEAIKVSGADSPVTSTVVFVRLLGEGIVVYRPAYGEPCGPNLVRLIVPEDYDPEHEVWEFEPGTTVRIEVRSLSDGDVMVAVALA